MWLGIQKLNTDNFSLLKTAISEHGFVFNVYLIKLASSVINIISDVVSLFICVLIICSKYSQQLKQGTMKMLLFRKFRVLILMVFLIACSMHILIDLLPKLERRSNSGCSCSHKPSEDPQNWAKNRARSGVESGWPNKHTLRILQDFSNEPNSNISSHSPEKIPKAGDKTEAFIRPEHYAQNGDKNRRFIQDTVLNKNVPVKGSRLRALFDHPLFKRALPSLTDEDTLFNVNTDIRFDTKGATENQEW